MSISEIGGRAWLPGIRALRASRRAAQARVRREHDDRKQQTAPAPAGARLCDYLDAGAALDPHAPCLTADGESRTYAEVQLLTERVTRALRARGVAPGDAVAVLAGNDLDAFTTALAISRLGAVWCPVNPRHDATQLRELLVLLECSALVFQAQHADLVAAGRHDVPTLRTLVCLDDDRLPAPMPGVLGWQEFLASAGRVGGSAATLAPWRPHAARATRPAFLALAPLTHAAGVLCFPVLASAGEIVIRGSLVMAGYPRQPGTTLPAYPCHDDLDVRYLDEDDVLSFVDRARELVIAW